jgi:hypothetical protein
MATCRAPSVPDRHSMTTGAGGSGDVIDGRVVFRHGAEDELTAAIGRLPRRRATASLSADQMSPGVARELFFLPAPPVVAV